MMSPPTPASNLDSSKQPSRTAFQQVMFNFAQDVCRRQEHAVKEPGYDVKEPGHDAKRRAYSPAEATGFYSRPSRYPHQTSVPQQSAAPASLHVPISREADRSIFSARDESLSKQFDVDRFQKQRAQRSQALYNSATTGETLSPRFGTAKRPFALVSSSNSPPISLQTYEYGKDTPFSPVYPPREINALAVEHQRSSLNHSPTQAIDTDQSPSGAQQSPNQIEDQSLFSSPVPVTPTVTEFRYTDNTTGPLSAPLAPTGQNVHQQLENARTSQAGVEPRSPNPPTTNVPLEAYIPGSYLRNLRSPGWPGSPVTPVSRVSPSTPSSSPPLLPYTPVESTGWITPSPLSPPEYASSNSASSTPSLSSPDQVSNLDLSTSIPQSEHSATAPEFPSPGHLASEDIHDGTVAQEDASPNTWSALSSGGFCRRAPRSIYHDVNPYRWAVSPPGADNVLPPIPQLPLPAPLYHESETADKSDVMKRAQQALRDHMKNRWNHAFDASRKLQQVMGVSPREGPHVAPGATTEKALAGHEGPQKFELLAGFGTPQACRDRERQHRLRSLRAILHEHSRRPSCRYTKLASLSIHQVKGDLDADAVRPRSQDSLPVCDSDPQGPLKLHNELLAHYASSPGTFDGIGTCPTQIGMFEIDMPIDSDRESRSGPFERWLMLEIATSHIFRVPGTEASQIGTIHRGVYGDQYCASAIYVAARLADLIVENVKPIQDILTDGTPCLRHDYTFGPNVRHRLEFSEKPGELCHNFSPKWLSANMEIAWCPKGPATSEEYKRHEEAYKTALTEGVRQDIARWEKIAHAMATGACRIVSRVVDEERIEKKKKLEAKKAAKSMTGSGSAQRSR